MAIVMVPVIMAVMVVPISMVMVPPIVVMMAVAPMMMPPVTVILSLHDGWTLGYRDGFQRGDVAAEVAASAPVAARPIPSASATARSALRIYSPRTNYPDCEWAARVTAAPATIRGSSCANKQACRPATAKRNFLRRSVGSG